MVIAVENKISFFNKYLTVWVAICMGIGVLISRFIPIIPRNLDKLTFYSVSIPITILLWLMIYPMMLKVDFQSVKKIKNNPKGLFLTWIVNWLIKPFTMFGITALFFYVIFQTFIPNDIAKEYVAGAILLGAAPCTAMVFVWSHLTKGNPAYTVVQVATNDLLLLVLFPPIVMLLLNVGGITIPWNTFFLSLLLFIVVPLSAGIITREWLVRKKGVIYFEHTFLPKFDNITIVGLLGALILIFSFQGKAIIDKPFSIFLISIPLFLQTVIIFGGTYFAARKMKLSHDIAGPSSLIGASNFFELAVAVAIAMYGTDSPAVLVTTVGVLIEVPLMLALVWVVNKTKYTISESGELQSENSENSQLNTTNA